MVERELFMVLGLSPGASSDEIRRAYRTLAKKYHPDSRGGSANAMAFVKVVAAYQRIMQDRMSLRPGHPRAAASGSRGAGPVASGSRSASATAGSRGTGPAASGSRGAGPTATGSRGAGPAAHAARSTPSSHAPGAQFRQVKTPFTGMFALGRQLLMSGDASSRISAAMELGMSGKSAAYAFLRKAFLDRDAGVVCAAVQAVGSLGIRQSAGELASLFSRAAPAVRKEILGVAVGMGPFNGFENILRLAAEDPDPSIRTFARSAGAFRHTGRGTRRQGGEL